jgi:hypothetical protein
VALDRRHVLKNGLILEMEYQKKVLFHSMTQRPDIVLHIPAEDSGAPADENNLMVIAIKKGASPEKAQEDFVKLDEMCEKLRYPLAVFINIESEEHHLRHYEGTFRDRFHAYAVTFKDGSVKVKYGWYEGGQLYEDDP